MKKEARTAAEQQIEALRQLKQAQPRRKAVPLPVAKPSKAPVAPASAFELSENRAARPAKKPGPQLPLSRAQWARLKARQKEHHEFRTRRAMGDWAAELLLALPPGTQRLSPEALEDLYRKMREWAEARGLR